MHKQHLNGGALISALFITAIAAIIAVALMVNERLLIHEGKLVMSSDQSFLNLQAMQLEAKNAVKNTVSQWVNTKNLPPNFIPLKKNLGKVQVGDMTITAQLDDEQGKYNINNLVNASNQPQFIALLQAVIQGMSLSEAKNIANAVTIWMTSNAQDPYYTTMHPPYRASQQEMTNISELRLVNGVTPTIYNALAPYLTALPVQKLSLAQQQQQSTSSQQSTVSPSETPVNINSVSAPVLMAINPGLSEAQAQSIIACRNQNGDMSNLQTFTTQCVQSSGVTTPLANLITTSSYFLVSAQAVYGDHSVSLKSLLFAQVENNTLKVTTVWQSFE